LALILVTALSFTPVIYEKIKGYRVQNRGQRPFFKKDMEIPLVVAFDNNYVCPALVSLSSLFSNAKEGTYYKIFFFITNEFTQENKNKILRLYDDYENFEAIFLNLSEESKQFKDINIFSARFSKEMFYRLKIPSLLKNQEKCIYMDVDTVVTGDLSDLYNEDLTGYCIGGVADGTRQAVQSDTEENRRKYFEYLGVDNMDDFINSGVILWNLVECRKNKVEDKFLEFVKKSSDVSGRTLNDQDTINSGCHGKIKDLALRYNVQTYYDIKQPYNNAGIFVKSFSERVWEEGRKNPVIIHYALNKAWSMFDVNFADRWWKCAKAAPNWVWTEVREYEKTLSG
jgi:lipopolysaccharide biosynthesis glycosyltransferase